MVPIANRTVTVSEDEIALEVGADDADLLTVPPGRTKRAPVGVPNQKPNCHGSPVVMKRPALVEPSERDVNWLWKLGHVRLTILPFSGGRTRERSDRPVRPTATVGWTAPR